jgi:hypothetical protein
MELIKTIIAALLGGLVVKLLDIGYSEYKLRSQKDKNSREHTLKNISPVLRSGDHLISKIKKLADEDFKSVVLKANGLLTADTLEVLYLLAHFYACLFLLMHKIDLMSQVTKDDAKNILTFLDLFENKKIRLIERLNQQAISQILMKREKDGYEMMSFPEFVEELEKKDSLERWISPLKELVLRLNHTKERQLLLKHGVLVHVFIDHFDPQHQATRDRPSYPNKLSERTRKDLVFRIFKIYLPFVHNTAKYTNKKPVAN